MKKTLMLSVVLASSLVLAGCSLYGGNQTSPQTNSPNNSGTTSQTQNQTQEPITGNGMISIKNFAFSPATLTIKKGATVTWTNSDSAPHQIKSATFNSAALNQGQSFSFTFNTAGTFDYSCAIHPSMLGKIIVQ